MRVFRWPTAARAVVLLAGLGACAPSAQAAIDQPPTVRVSGPLTSATVTQAVHPIVVDATDNMELVALRVYEDGVLKRTIPMDYAVSWHGDAGPYDARPGARAPGAHTVKVEAVDSYGMKASKTLSFTILATAPDIEVGGDLEASAHAPLTGDTYDVWLDADLGSPSVQSGTGKLEILADGVRRAYVEQPCPASPCDGDLAWDFLREDFAVGRHTIEARVTDIAGSVASQTFTVDLSATRTADPPDSESPGTTAAFSTATSMGASGDGCASIAQRIAPRGVAAVLHAGSTLVRETTVDLVDGTYVVVRCDPAGRLLRAQRVGPVEVPGGSRRLVLAETRTVPGSPAEYITDYPLYGDPADPAIAEAWRRHGTEILSRVLPRTRPAALRP